MALRDIDEIPRDQWGRPLLILPNDYDNRTAFTRASTLSTAIENTWGLEAWKRRQIIQGLARREDLIAKVPVSNTKALDAIVAETFVEMETDKTASIGTHIHALTETVDRGFKLPPNEPLEMRRIIASYQKMIEKWEILDIEQFVGCIQIRAAGTFDRVLRAPSGELYIGDIKTGIDAPKYAHTAQVQLAVYAHGTQYIYPGDQWAPKSLREKGINQERAVIIHLPQDGTKGGMHWVDIDKGWKYAIVAAKVRAWWNTRPTTPMNGSR